MSDRLISRGEEKNTCLQPEKMTGLMTHWSHWYRWYHHPPAAYAPSHAAPVGRVREFWQQGVWVSCVLGRGGGWQ